MATATTPAEKKNTEDARRTRVARALANPVYFGEYYMRPFDPAWDQPLPDFAHDMLRFMFAEKRAVIELAPEMLKTTLGSQLYPLWRTCDAAYFRRQLRGMLMSEEEGIAAANLAVIAWHIEHNELIARDFCDDGGQPLVFPSVEEDVWRQDAITIQRPFPSKDPTWQAKGIDAKGIHGRRLDIFIGDDMVTPRNAHSPALRKQALDTMDLQVLTRIVASGQALVLGNFNDEADLPETLAKRKRWGVFKRPTVSVEGNPSEPAAEEDVREMKGQLLWPNNWTWERLLAELEDTPNRFRRIHLFDPHAEHGERLSVSWINYIEPEATPLSECRFFIGVDPAAGSTDKDTTSKDLDFVNITVGGLHQAHLDLVLSLDVRASLTRSVELLGIVHDKFSRIGLGVARIAAGKQALDNYFMSSIEMGRPDLVPLVDPVPLPGSKEERLEALGPFFQTKYVRVWEEIQHQRTSDDADQAQELTFEEQVREFPYGKHDDKLDGADVCIRSARGWSPARRVELDLQAR
jgi:hypothetical protein